MRSAGRRGGAARLVSAAAAACVAAALLALAAAAAPAAAAAASAQAQAPPPGSLRSVRGRAAAASLLLPGAGIWGLCCGERDDARCARALGVAAEAAAIADGGEALRFAACDGAAAAALLERARDGGGGGGGGGGSGLPVALAVGPAGVTALPEVSAEALVRGALAAVPRGAVEAVGADAIAFFFLSGRARVPREAAEGENNKTTTAMAPSPQAQAVLVSGGEASAGAPVWWRALAAEFGAACRPFGHNATGGGSAAAREVAQALGGLADRFGAPLTPPYVAVLPPGRPELARLRVAPADAPQLRRLLAAMLDEWAGGAAACEAGDVVCAERAAGGGDGREAVLARAAVHLAGPRQVSVLRDEVALRALYSLAALEEQSGFVLVALPPAGGALEGLEVQALDAMAVNVGTDVMPVMPLCKLLGGDSEGELYERFARDVGADLRADATQLVLVHPASRRAVVYPGGATLTLVHAVIGAVLTESVERELLPVASESGLPGLSGGDDAYEYDGREELR